jgi:hypothetical protein
MAATSLALNSKWLRQRRPWVKGVSAEMLTPKEDTSQVPTMQLRKIPRRYRLTLTRLPANAAVGAGTAISVFASNAFGCVGTVSPFGGNLSVIRNHVSKDSKPHSPEQLTKVRQA